ncbi:hypothetical protein M3Y99_01062800 [Aphelenchoides fujianensis]|nr:hypothetical protein M3Y99_01062800 [Aphelenchoides fujianensis]
MNRPRIRPGFLRLLAAVGLLAPLVRAQQNCSEAPSASLRMVCEQLHKWDANARAQNMAQSRLVLPPGISSLDGIAADLAPIARTAFQCMDLGCLCAYMGGSGVEGTNRCTLRDGQPLRRAVRREYRTLSDDERERFHAAVRQIKANGEFDRLARIHSQFAESGGAHSGPAFLPWHRELVKRFEIAIRNVDPTVAVPYWDSVLDNNLPRPTDSILWTDEFMGASDGAGNLINGPFSPWRTLNGRANIVRRVGAQGSLFRESEIAFAARQTQVEQVLAFTAPRQGCPLRTNWNVLEYTHGNVHIYVGGDMLDQSTSANDPIFYLHHSFVDLVYEMWRQQMQSRANRERDYPLDQQLCSSAAHFGSSLMRPFEPMRNVDGLSNAYTDNLYEYAPRPVCPTCGGSAYLFCMRTGGPGRCAAKIRPGGSCQGLSNADSPCHNGECRAGVCVAVRESPAPQRPPPTPSRPLVEPASQETCFNEQECCSLWQQQGECTRNANYMRLWCKASCGICRPRYDLNVECSDRHINCARWAAGGECARNPSWMSENCRQACGRCSRSRAQTCGAAGAQPPPPSRPAPLPPPPESNSPSATCDSPGCFNENICCQLFGLQGQCAANATWMACNCRVSCAHCIPRDYNYGACEDYHRDCGSWSRQGECERNPWMLENCRRSCNSCFSAAELRRMCRVEGGGPRPQSPRRPPPPPPFGESPPAFGQPPRQRRPPSMLPPQFPPPMFGGPDFDLDGGFPDGFDVPGVVSLRWGRAADKRAM